MIDLSLIIPIYNEEKNIERCLKSLAGIADEVADVVQVGGRFEQLAPHWR